MPRPHRYSTESLAVDHPAFVARSPGLDDIERMFPSPSSSGRGRLAVEGGISIVAGRGMGKTSLMLQLARRLDEHREIATALVSMPHVGAYPEEDGFYAYLGDLVRMLREALRASPRVQHGSFRPVADALAIEPTWDTPGVRPGLSPRGMERWIGALGAAAVHTPGIALLFDDVDRVNSITWRNAFVAGLRFTFQTCAGITPIYAVWNIFADESLPGSNYFRNVTRPLFLEALSSHAIAPATSERRALIDVDLAELSDAAALEVSRLVGGHPQLLQRVLGDLATALPADAVLAKVTAAEARAMLDANADAQRSIARACLAETPALATALREIVRAEQTPRTLSRGLQATGLVDADIAGRPFVPERVREVL